MKVCGVYHILNVYVVELASVGGGGTCGTQIIIFSSKCLVFFFFPPTGCPITMVTVFQLINTHVPTPCGSARCCGVAIPQLHPSLHSSQRDALTCPLPLSLHLTSPPSFPPLHPSFPPSLLPSLPCGFLSVVSFTFLL